MLDNCRVLIVEDEVLIALDVARSLEGAGAIETIHARNPADASAIALTWPTFDLALVDARMGSADSVALVQRLEEAGVAVVVASADRELEARFPSATMLSKPYGEAELLSACRSALAMSRT